LGAPRVVEIYLPPLPVRWCAAGNMLILL
jgi:hypothetical protein